MKILEEYIVDLHKEIQYLKEVIDFNKRQYQEAMLAAEQEIAILNAKLEIAENEISVIKNN